YPAITSATCSWTAILSWIWQPDVVWSCWKPATLGSYSSVTAIWEAWAKGERVAGVGRKPPLCGLEWLWGAQKNTTMRKGQQQSWRPRNDAMARQLWAHFMYFVSRIEKRLNNGKTSAEAMHELDDGRGTLSLSQFCKRTQPKRQ
ncbi:uncharacterized protein LAESUDRAFT_622485, partial [Laetiporus sulphureus 93-53]